MLSRTYSQFGLPYLTQVPQGLPLSHLVFLLLQKVQTNEFRCLFLVAGIVFTPGASVKSSFGVKLTGGGVSSVSKIKVDDFDKSL